jgi:hypothetical protein
MSFWIQHGYGKSDKIDRVIKAVDGVVLSPADESVDGLGDLVTHLKSEGVTTLLDPQFFVSTIDGGVGRLHEDHDLGYAGIDWSSDPQAIADCAKAVVAANAAVGVKTVIAPAPLQRALGDKWAPLGLQFARAVRSEVGGTRTYGSLILHEIALTKWADVELWLTSITKLDVKGFYLFIVRSAGADYPSQWDPERLSHLYRIVYRLVNNDYEVIVGYTDVDGLGCAALGAGAATGWFHSQRRFQEAKWRPSDGGAQALPRFLSDGLLTPLRVEEARDLIKAGEDTVVSSRRSERDLLLTSYDITTSRNQYLAAMARLNKRASELGDAEARVERLLSDLRGAQKELKRLGGKMARGLTYANQLERLSSALIGAGKAEGFTSKP